MFAGFGEKNKLNYLNWFLVTLVTENGDAIENGRQQRTKERQQSKKDGKVEQEGLVVCNRRHNGYGCLRFFFFLLLCAVSSPVGPLESLISSSICWLWFGEAIP